MYIYTHTCMHVYLYIHIYIYTIRIKKRNLRKENLNRNFWIIFKTFCIFRNNNNNDDDDLCFPIIVNFAKLSNILSILLCVPIQYKLYRKEQATV